MKELERINTDTDLSVSKKGQLSSIEVYDKFGAMAYGIILQIVPQAHLAQEILVNVFSSPELQSCNSYPFSFSVCVIKLARAKAVEAKRKMMSIAPKSIESGFSIEDRSPKLIFDLAFCEGYTPEEVAEKLNMSKSEVLRAFHDFLILSQFIMSHTAKNGKFIDSGLLESYALGFATPDEKEYIKERILTNPEISDHIADIETGIQRFFNGRSTLPPSELREIVQLRSTGTEVKKEKHVFNRNNYDDISQKNQYLDIEVNDTYIKVHKNWRPAFIAVFVLAKVFLITGMYYYFKTTSLEQEIIRLKTEINQTK